VPIIADIVKPKPISVAENPILLKIRDVKEITPPAPNDAKNLILVINLR
tara:strand:+ start:340 stop:486 length:147 start_codon:yes stop_codon:yes gene_type:complete